MSSSHPSADAEPEPQAPPRADFRDALAWMALGAAILVGAVTMDRLEAQDINPYTVPGLLPGLLGIGILCLGALLGLRAWRQGALRAAPPVTATPAADGRQLALVLALCSGFDLLLVGHGLPFWLAAAIFVTVAILALQRPQRRAAGRTLTIRAVLVALLIGLGAGGGITLIFQEIFLVRLP